MSRFKAPTASLKRKQPEPRTKPLTSEEEAIYTLILGKESNGCLLPEIKRNCNFSSSVTKSLKSLMERNMIKQIANVQNKGTKTYMASEFEPSKELTGGEWYSNGELDVDFIESMKEGCRRIVKRLKVATVDGIMDLLKPSLTVDMTRQQFEEILRALILENAIVEVKSNGVGEFSSIPVGKICYKVRGGVKQGGGGAGGEPTLGAMASIPCGVCPRIRTCTPDGVISPKTCIYYQKWLDF